ncbi:quinone oxidoreductase [Phanerochaete sordida]|uniref:Probable quinone oxidoreductase n=1 Tax=Phanerochaete sordida TaxID=48140 RepID=A0A9P3G7X4_9APHY|nr:quinone oxidoreductase [Phanerochaete sordida]
MSLPETVQAITISAHGGPEVVQKISLPFPERGPEDIIVKVVWGGVNTIDTYFRKGLYPAKKFPLILGTEGSGTIVKLPTDEKVLNDPAFKKRGYKVGGRVALNALGAFAEYVSYPWKSVYPVPDYIPLDIASSCISHCLTALTTMTESYHVNKGDVILVHTIAGGLGLAFLAYAKSRGATVIGTTSTPAKAALARAAGADHVVLYTQEDTVQRVLELTGGEGVHAVFDGVGKDTFLSDFEMLRRKGTLVAIGNASGAPDPVSPLKLSAKNLKLVRPSMFNYIVTPEEADHYLGEMWEALRSGLFKIKVHRVFPFTAEGAREAQQEINTPGSSVTGKLLIRISEE